MRIFIVCKVRGVAEDSEEYRRQKEYVDSLRERGHIVHWPHQNTEQKDPEHGTRICRTTFGAIFRADEVHVIYDPTSEGFVADLMMTFALDEFGKRTFITAGRRRVIIVNPEAVEQKIKEEIEQQSAQGIDPQFAKSYTMVLKNLADETSSVQH